MTDLRDGIRKVNVNTGFVMGRRGVKFLLDLQNPEKAGFGHIFQRPQSPNIRTHKASRMCILCFGGWFTKYDGYRSLGSHDIFPCVDRGTKERKRDTHFKPKLSCRYLLFNHFLSLAINSQCQKRIKALAVGSHKQ